MHVSDAYVCEFQGRNSVKEGGGGECKTGEKFHFFEKGKTVISKFSRSRMTKWTEPLNSSREI